MTIIPDKAVALWARTDADFEQEFLFFDDEAQSQPMNLTGWTFRFVVKKNDLDASAWLVAEGASITVSANSVKAFIEREVLAAAMPADQKRVDGVFALQATGPGDLDAVFVAGRFPLVRGL